MRAVGERPWWLYVPASEWERKYDVLRTPAAGADDSALAMLAALAAVLLVAALRRRWDLCAAALIALGLCAAMVSRWPTTPPRSCSRKPSATRCGGARSSALGGAGAVLGAVAGVLGGLVRVLLAHVVRSGVLRGGWSGRGGGWKGRRRQLPLALAGLVGLAFVGVAVASEEQPDSHVYEYRSITAMATALERVLPAGESIDYRFGALDLGTQPMEPGIRFLLVRHRDRVLAPGSFPRLGSYYELAGHPYQWVVYLTDGARRQPHMRLVSRVSFRSPWGREVLSAWVRRAQQAHRGSAAHERGWRKEARPTTSATRAGTRSGPYFSSRVM